VSAQARQGITQSLAAAVATRCTQPIWAHAAFTEVGTVTIEGASVLKETRRRSSGRRGHGADQMSGASKRQTFSASARSQPAWGAPGAVLVASDSNHADSCSTSAVPVRKSAIS
jgi:hypothetical protein